MYEYEQRPEAREKRRKRENAWFAAHPEKRAEKNRKAFALRRGAPDASLTAEQWRGVLDLFAGECAYCRRRDVKLTMDHFVAVDRGGKHSVSNVVPACQECNSSKRHSDPFEWMESRGFDGDWVVAMICETRHCA